MEACGHPRQLTCGAGMDEPDVGQVEAAGGPGPGSAPAGGLPVVGTGQVQHAHAGDPATAAPDGDGPSRR